MKIHVQFIDFLSKVLSDKTAKPTDTPLHLHGCVIQNTFLPSTRKSGILTSSADVLLDTRT